MASASPTDSFDWLSQATARILGTSAAASPLRRDRLLKDMPEAERVAFSRALRQRFQRVVDEKTERVTWVIAAGLPLSGTGNGDPELERLARTLIPPIRGALDEVVPHRCRDAACAQDVAAGIAGLRDQLTRLDEELRAPPNGGYLQYLLGRTNDALASLDGMIRSANATLAAEAHERTAVAAGVLRQAVLKAGNADHVRLMNRVAVDARLARDAVRESRLTMRDVEDERDNQAVNTATTIFNALRAAVTVRLDDIAIIRDLGAFYRCVEHAAQPLSDAASNLLRHFASLGIDDRQLQPRNLRDPAQPVAADQISLGEWLRRLAEEPKLWRRFAQTGSGQHVQRIVGSAAAIMGALPAHDDIPANTERMVAQLGLDAGQCCDDGRSILSEMRRLVALTRSLLTPITTADIP